MSNNGRRKTRLTILSSLFDTLIDDVASQFGLGSNAGPLVREILSMITGTPDADRARLVSLVAAQFGLTNDEATQRVARMESDAKATFAAADQRARDSRTRRRKGWRPARGPCSPRLSSASSAR